MTDGGQLPSAPTLGPAWGLLIQRVWGSEQIVNVRLPRSRVTVRVPSLPSGPQDSSSPRCSARRLCHGRAPRTDTRVRPGPSSAGTTPDTGPCRSPEPLLPSVSWENCFNIPHGSRASEEGQTDRGARADGAESRGGPLLGKQRLLTRPPEEYLPQTLMRTNEVCTVNQDRRPGRLGIGPGDSAYAQGQFATRQARLPSPAV